VRRPTQILGFLWQLIKAQLLSNISLKQVPGLVNLVNRSGNESVRTFVKLSAEKMLLRWVNFHLTTSLLTIRTIVNFGIDLADCEALFVLLSCLHCHLNKSPVMLLVDWSVLEPVERAQAVLDLAKKHIGVATFLQATDIVNGNSKLCLCFLAQLFNAVPALPPVEDIQEVSEAVKDLELEISASPDSVQQLDSCTNKVESRRFSSTSGSGKLAGASTKATGCLEATTADASYSSPVRRMLTTMATDDTETKAYVVREEARLISDDFELRLEAAKVERRSRMEAQMAAALKRTYSLGGTTSPRPPPATESSPDSAEKKYTSLESSYNGVIREGIDIRLGRVRNSPHALSVPQDETTNAGHLVEKANLESYLRIEPHASLVADLCLVSPAVLSSAALEKKRISLLEMIASSNGRRGQGELQSSPVTTTPKTPPDTKDNAVLSTTAHFDNMSLSAMNDIENVPVCAALQPDDNSTVFVTTTVEAEVASVSVPEEPLTVTANSIDKPSAVIADSGVTGASEAVGIAIIPSGEEVQQLSMETPAVAKAAAVPAVIAVDEQSTDAGMKVTPKKSKSKTRTGKDNTETKSKETSTLISPADDEPHVPVTQVEITAPDNQKERRTSKSREPKTPAAASTPVKASSSGPSAPACSEEPQKCFTDPPAITIVTEKQAAAIITPAVETKKADAKPNERRDSKSGTKKASSDKIVASGGEALKPAKDAKDAAGEAKDVKESPSNAEEKFFDKLLKQAERNHETIVVLYVGNLPMDATSHELRQFFEVRDIAIKAAVMKLGFGYVVLDMGSGSGCSTSRVQNVVSLLDGVPFDGGKGGKQPRYRQRSIKLAISSQLSKFREESKPATVVAPITRNLQPAQCGDLQLSSEAVAVSKLPLPPTTPAAVQVVAPAPAAASTTALPQPLCVYVGNLSNDVKDWQLREYFETNGFRVDQVMISRSYGFVYIHAVGGIDEVKRHLDGKPLGKKGKPIRVGLGNPHQQAEMGRDVVTTDEVPHAGASMAASASSAGISAARTEATPAPAFEILHISRLPPTGVTIEALQSIFRSKGFEFAEDTVNLSRAFGFVRVDKSRYNIDDLLEQLNGIKYSDFGVVPPYDGRLKSKEWTVRIQKSRGASTEPSKIPAVSEQVQLPLPPPAPVSAPATLSGSSSSKAATESGKPTQVLLLKPTTWARTSKELVNSCVSRFTQHTGIQDTVLQVVTKGRHCFLLMSSVPLATEILNRFNNEEIIVGGESGSNEVICLEYANGAFAHELVAKHSKPKKSKLTPEQKRTEATVEVGSESSEVDSSIGIHEKSADQTAAAVPSPTIIFVPTPAADTGAAARVESLRRDYVANTERLGWEVLKSKEDADERLQRRLLQRRSLSGTASSLSSASRDTTNTDYASDASSTPSPSPSPLIQQSVIASAAASESFQQADSFEVFIGAVTRVLSNDGQGDKLLNSTHGRDSEESVEVMQACGRTLSRTVSTDYDTFAAAAAEVGFTGSTHLSASSNSNSTQVTVFSAGHKLTTVDACLLIELGISSVHCKGKPAIGFASLSVAASVESNNAEAVKKGQHAQKLQHSAIASALLGVSGSVNVHDAGSSEDINSVRSLLTDHCSTKLFVLHGNFEDKVSVPCTVSLLLL
jgi:hypothetical protein